MSWLSRLLHPLIDRLATTLAEKIEIELEAAVDAALDQTELRIGELLSRAEARLQAAAGQQLHQEAQAAGMVPVSALQAATQIATKDAAAVAAEEIRAMLRRQGNAGGQRAAYPEVPDR